MNKLTEETRKNILAYLHQQEDIQFIIDIERDGFKQLNYRGTFIKELEYFFSKFSKVRAEIYRQLYITGYYDSWLEGFGTVRIVDVKRAVDYYTNKEIK